MACRQNVMNWAPSLQYLHCHQYVVIAMWWTYYPRHNMVKILFHHNVTQISCRHNLTNIAPSSQCEENNNIVAMWCKYLIIIMWEMIPNVTMWISSIVLVNHCHGNPWSLMHDNCQTWLTIFNHGQPQSTKASHNEGLGKVTMVKIYGI
jgi:hypothetical protein